MHRFFVPQLYNETMTIEGVDARHISKVLRMQPGAQLQIVSDDGVSALAEISAIDSECVTVHCLEKLAESHEPAVRLILAQGLAKGEKMEFIIQKAVEMGAYSVVPVAMEHSVVRLDGAKAAKKVERWQKIAESAAKQSKRDIIPEVQPVQTMAQMLAANDCATHVCFAPNPPPILGFDTRIFDFGISSAFARILLTWNTIWVELITCSLP